MEEIEQKLFLGLSSTKSFKDAALDPIQDYLDTPLNWPEEFKRLQREIIELWHTCNVSMAHRSYFFLLFRGDQKDCLYLEVELRRLKYIAHNSKASDDLSLVSRFKFHSTFYFLYISLFFFGLVLIYLIMYCVGNKQAARRRWLERGLSWASWCRGNYPRKRERTCSWDGELRWTQGTGGSSWRTDSGLITKTWVMSERVPPSLVSSMDSSTWTWLPPTCLASTLLSDHLVPRNLVFGNAVFCPSPFCNFGSSK